MVAAKREEEGGDGKIRRGREAYVSLRIYNEGETRVLLERRGKRVEAEALELGNALEIIER